jgi:hypothetical protein
MGLEIVSEQGGRSGQEKTDRRQTDENEHDVAPLGRDSIPFYSRVFTTISVGCPAT